jgi:hypothetical protein
VRETALPNKKSKNLGEHKMNKVISTVILITVFAAASVFAADGHINSPGVTCAAGHINSPGVVSCTSPADGNRPAVVAQPADDNSVLTVLGTFLSEYNPLGFFFD